MLLHSRRTRRSSAAQEGSGDACASVSKQPRRTAVSSPQGLVSDSAKSASFCLSNRSSLRGKALQSGSPLRQDAPNLARLASFAERFASSEAAADAALFLLRPPLQTPQQQELGNNEGAASTDTTLARARWRSLEWRDAGGGKWVAETREVKVDSWLAQLK